MRPYLAVIRDSFHEALVSRVLWILLAISSLVLAALVPLSIVEQAGSVLSDDDLYNRDSLIGKIVAQGKSKDPSPGKRIWELLDDSTREALQRKPGTPGEMRPRYRFADTLQRLIERDDFYVPALWAKVRLSPAARSLYDKGLANLPRDQAARFNRLALEAAYPDEIAPAPPKQVRLAYFHWELGLTLPVEPEQLFPAINQIVVFTLGTLLGVAGVFVAVLVTASMIPQMFEAGAVDLLLSKPISRSGLFLAKFVGGCAFIAINAAYFIGGLYLILGWRFGLWNERLLYAVPLYLFLFTIYYAVSALAGLVWRNAIVSVVLAVVFWLACWILGTAVNVVESVSLAPRELVAILPAGDTLVAVNRDEVFRWDAEEADWRRIFIARDAGAMPFMFARSLAGPIYDAAGERLLACRVSMPGFAPLRAVNRLLIGKRDDDWRRTEGVTVPDGAFELYATPEVGVLVVAAHGIFHLEGNSEAKQQDINVFGLHIPLPEKGGRFADIGPKLQMRPLQSAALDAETGAIVLFDGYRLVLFARDDKGHYVQVGDKDFDRRNDGEVAIGGGKVFLTLADGDVRLYDDRLEPCGELSSGMDSPPKSAILSPDGRYLVIVSRNARLWLYDVRQNQQSPLAVAGQGDISTAAFEGDDKLWVVDRLTRATEYDLTRDQVARQVAGQMPLAERIYRYVLHPLYTVFPKPSKLNETVNYVLTRDSPLGGLRLDNNNRNAKVEVWGPVWSNLAFLVVVLGIGCLYVSRRDF